MNQKKKKWKRCRGNEAERGKNERDRHKQTKTGRQRQPDR